MVLGEFQRSAGNAGAAGTVKEHDTAVGKVDVNFCADPELSSSENNARQKPVINADFKRRFHAGRHDAVDFSFKSAAFDNIHKLGADPEDKIRVRQFSNGYSVELIVVGFRDVAAEPLIFIAFLDVARLRACGRSFALGS